MVHQWLREFLGIPLHALYQQLEAMDPLFLYPVHWTRYRLVIVGLEPQSDWQRGIVLVDHTGITVYPRTRRMDTRLHFPAKDLCWFGRPTKYQEGDNQIWLHFAIDGQWQVLELMLRLSSSPMQALVRALKQIATPEQVRMYRRRRPYIHVGPVLAFPAEQDIYGAWTLAAQPVNLYLMPYALVLLDEAAVRQVIPLERIQQIEALRRVDRPTADGIVRFRLVAEDQANPQTQPLAFSLPDFISFGASLAEAAKRTLTDPFTAYQKKAKTSDEADDWDEDDLDDADF